ncbi:MAG: hypothetical protein KGR26_09610 [Cyanobacteria bacterium REEB65]|nr:hypothetical protein [Cyanobacteria bacterium REEB65]
MRKIPTLFRRDDRTRRVISEVTPGCEWVLSGDGTPTRKFDGTCALIRMGRLFKRYEARADKTPPWGFEPAQDPDPITGNQPGWLPIGDGPEDRWFREALVIESINDLFIGGCVVEAGSDGTYELCGPKVQGNPERLDRHILVRHGIAVLDGVPHDFEGLRSFLDGRDLEGIVWYADDGRMVKLKLRDFGFRRPGS